MKRIQLAILFMLVCFCSSAQDFRLGKVSREELEQKFYPGDTSAPAAILYKKGTTRFMLTGQWSLVTEVECRIKIYKKEGYKYAIDQLIYYSGGRPMKAYYSDAVTYNLVNGKIEKTKLKGEGEFDEKVQSTYSVKTITMPNVKEGSVIEFKTTIDSPYFTMFKDWYFQYDIPANYVSYEVAIPSYFTYNRFLSGYVHVEQSKTNLRTSTSGGFNESVVTFTAKNVNALKKEDYVTNIENYTSVLKHELASTNFPAGKKEYATDWATVVKRIYDDENFGKELGYSSYFKGNLEVITTGTKSPEEKMNIIFDYVKNRMKWNGIAGYNCVKGVVKAYDDRSGNTAEINLILTAMLREAGLSAHPVLVSTQSNGMAVFPNRTAYNYVITAVETGKGTILLDATSKYAKPNILPVRALNWVGRIIRSDGSSLEVDLVPKINSKEIVNIAAAVSDDGKLSGKIRKMYYDHYGYLFLDKYDGVNTQSMSDNIERQYPGIEVSNYTLLNESDATKPVTEEYGFTHNGAVDVIDGKIYLNPALFFVEPGSPFKRETRDYPVDFTFPFQKKIMVNITIPKGYTVESLPGTLSLAMEENIGSFKFNIAASGDVIQAGITCDINYASVSQDYYPTLRDFFNKMIEKQKEKIVLKTLTGNRQ